MEVVSRKFGPAKYFEFVDVLFKNQSSFSNSQFKTKSPIDLLQLLSSLLIDFGISQSELSDLMDDDLTLDAMKACQRRGISLGVWSTPTFYLNGALLTKVSGSDDSGEWIEYLESFDTA